MKSFIVLVVILGIVGILVLGAGLVFKVVEPMLFPTPTPTATPTPIPGSISGTASWLMQNQSNRVIVGLVVTAKRCASCGIMGTGVTDGLGNYRINSLPPYTYWVTAYQAASTTGLTIAEKCWYLGDVVVNAGQDTQVNLHYGNTADPMMCKKQGSGLDF